MQNSEGKKNELKVAVIGLGASGAMAAVQAAQEGCRVSCFEKNEKLGKKIYITGKGRCNVTNARPFPEFLQGIGHNPKFLYSALTQFDNQALMRFFQERACPLKTERGQRVFPVSDHASDINKCFERELKKLGVSCFYHETFCDFSYEKGSEGEGFYLLLQGDGGARRRQFFHRLILATGGFSYPSTGSTGDGYHLLQEKGFSMKEAVPSLVPFVSRQERYRAFRGLTLKNIALAARIGKREWREFGDLLFTDQGISGPVVLTLSSKLANLWGKKPKFSLDFKAALTPESLRHRLIREREEGANRSVKTLCQSFLPKNLVPFFLMQMNLDSHKPLHQWTRQEEDRFLLGLKHFPLEIDAPGPFSQAVTTRGGLDTKELNPKTMECKKMPGLYVVGELVDVDAYTGGYNLQIAFSTGYVAGKSAAIRREGEKE